MCLIISVVAIVFSINLLMTGDYGMGLGALAVGAFFLTLMVRNILRVRKEKGGISPKECLRCDN